MKKEEKNNQEKITFICFIIASICFYISAIFGFINKSSMAVVHLCLGSTFLCLSSVHYNNYKKNNDSKKDEESK